MVLKTQPMLSPAQRLQPNAHVLGEKGERGNAPILESSVVVLRKRGRSLGVKWWRIVRRSCSVGPPLASRSMLSNKNKNPVKILEENFKILTTTAWRSENIYRRKKEDKFWRVSTFRLAVILGLTECVFFTDGRCFSSGCPCTCIVCSLFLCKKALCCKFCRKII